MLFADEHCVNIVIRSAVFIPAFLLRDAEVVAAHLTLTHEPVWIECPVPLHTNHETGANALAFKFSPPGRVDTKNISRTYRDHST